MASNGPSQGLVPNGIAPHLSHRPQTPAYTVGNQFVQQFYSVLHAQPEFLYRFYTDASTVTHSDCGSDTEPPSSVTVTTQKDIRSRMAEMGFEQARTEIWSVDSQYSMTNGVLVMVTGTLECKGKKKRDFCQSFFLAPQEKGYYVLNDVFRYCPNRQPQSDAQPKESYNSQHNPALQAGLYQQQQVQAAPSQLYYPGVPPQPPATHHTAYAQPYQASAPPAATHAASNLSQKAAIPPQQSQFRSQAQQTPEPASSAPQPVEPPTPAQEPKPVQQPPKPISQPAVEPPKPIASPAKPKEISAPPPAAKEEPAPKPAAPEPANKQPEKAKENQALASQSTQTPSPEPSKPAAQPPKQEAPSGPVTYADRLKMNASANTNSSQKAAPRAVPITQPRPIPTSQQQRPTTSPAVPSSVAKPPETSAGEGNNSDDAQQANGSKLTSSAKEDEVVTTSIFVRNLPDDITTSKLHDTFSQYGKIKGGLQGVQLKQQKSSQKNDFAFVEYEELSSMQAAVAAKTLIDDKSVQAMERRPFVGKEARFGGRAGRGEGRGEGQGFRGRGEGRGRGGGVRDGRPHTTGGRAEGRPEGGRGRGYEGRGSEGGRGRGERTRGRFNAHSGGRQGPAQSAPAARPTPA